MESAQIAIPMLRQLVKRPRVLDVFARFDRWGNLFAPERYSYPYPLWERCRADGPIVKRMTYGGWVVTGYDEARLVLSSEHSSVGESIDTLFKIKPYNKLSADSRNLLRQMLLFQDGEPHARLRRLVSRTFTPRAVARLRPMAETIATELAEAAASGPHDAVIAFASPFPVRVISALLGVPEERWEWAHHNAKIIIQMIDPINNFDPDEINPAVDEILTYFTELAAERRAEPTDDLLSGLVVPDDDGDELEHRELMSMMGILYFAGFETTSNVLGNSIVALAANPDQRELIRNQPELWPNAAEELLRYDPAIQIVNRTITHDVEIGGEHLKAGELAAVLLGAANRDPRQGSDLHDLRLDRDHPQSVSFGHGVHHCLGAAIARLEIEVGMKTYLDVMGDYTVDTNGTEWKRSVSLKGPTRLPVTPG